MLEFVMKGRRCGMKFLDADVKQPLGAVSAMVDEGNTVVFSQRWGNYVEHDETHERIPISRKGGTYVMILESAKEKGDKAKDKTNKTEGHMEVNGTENNEDMGDDKIVCRRRLL